MYYNCLFFKINSAFFVYETQFAVYIFFRTSEPLLEPRQSPDYYMDSDIMIELFQRRVDAFTFDHNWCPQLTLLLTTAQFDSDMERESGEFVFSKVSELHFLNPILLLKPPHVCYTLWKGYDFDMILPRRLWLIIYYQ